MASPVSTMKRTHDTLEADNLESIAEKKVKISIDPLELLNLNDDCLEAIMEHVDLSDLVNLAEAHDRFIPITCLVFSRRYRKKKLFLNIGHIRFGDSNAFEIQKYCEKYFQYFGQLMSRLFINFLGDRADECENLFLKQCCTNLVDLELTFCTTSTLEMIIEPFEKVKKLSITKSALGEQMSQLNRWFPNVHHLELVNIELTQPKFIEVHFPRLKIVKIYNEKTTIPQSSVGEMFRLNPQINSLILGSDYDEDFLRLISKHLQLLIELILWSSDDRFLSFDDRKIKFEHVEKFKLFAPSPRAEFLVNVPFIFPHLKELEFDGFNEFKGQIMDFILQHKGLKKLSLVPFIDGWDDLVYDDLAMIAKTLQDLDELEFCADTFITDDVIQLLTNNKQLKRVRLLFIDVPTTLFLGLSTNFMHAIQNKWKWCSYYIGELDCFYVYLDKEI